MIEDWGDELVAAYVLFTESAEGFAKDFGRILLAAARPDIGMVHSVRALCKLLRELSSPKNNDRSKKKTS
jgi:hypothetical protein